MRKHIITLISATLMTLMLNGCKSGNSANTRTSDTADNREAGANLTGVDLNSLRLEYRDINHLILMWDPIEDATYYEINIARDMMLVNYTYPVTVEEPAINLADYIQQEGEYWIKIKAEGTNVSALTSVTVTADGASLD